jgi:Reverse transcriptase (RNA-dependent DNA polymerase)
VILLSDIRLNSSKQSYAVHDLTKKFRFYGYDFYHNSTLSSRGVGILVRSALNAEILSEYRDHDCNILLIQCRLLGSMFVFGSLYGPNNNDGAFFANLSDNLAGYRDCFKILGGDLNATWDNRDVTENLDVINMQAIPSKYRSDRFREIAHQNELTDPYRFKQPCSREFTYVPNARANKNRSRLDFFLVPEVICGPKMECWIENTLISTAFDHKLIGVSWSDKNKGAGVDRNVIKNQIISNPSIKFLMKCVVFEAHLTHSDPAAVPAYVKNELLEKIGMVMYKLETKSKLELDHEMFDRDNREIISELSTEVETDLELLPDLEFFQGLPKSCDDDIFFEALITKVKTCVLGAQQKIYNVINAKKVRLTKRLNQLKTDYLSNKNEIFRVEQELANHLEKLLRDEVENMGIFTRLNNEKITPYFVNLAKQISGSDSTDIIADGTGTTFENKEANEKYITDFYSDLYKNPPNDKCVTKDDIINFLGDTAGIDEVVNSKLSDPERASLDRDLQIHELDTAIRECNKKSAPGLDGFSNKFIEHFWHYFRVPLLNYATCCFDKGKLTDTFRTAKIRLIPKKGDKKRIGNWRPISLLSCFYKIVSRAFANRLKRVIDKITNIGQKGYSKTKQCQEVLIQIITGIENCKKKNVRGGILSLDIKKAFDSISHSYLKSVLEFFNFGEKFIKNIMTLCSNRLASIIFGGNRLGKTFKLERGNAQGDTISPFLFNIGYQILIFKLNFDLQIDSFLEVPAIPRTHSPLPPSVSKKPRKVFAFADDCTILTILNAKNLNRINAILRDYGLISGLECNVEKSFIKQIGNITVPVSETECAGFKVTDKITILGLTFAGDGTDYSDSLSSITNKVREKINVWNRFKLSLPGRINIAKTMLYSQLNYLGCFLRFPSNVIDQTELLIKNYVKTGTKISEKRIFEPVCNGGLGLFKIKEFLDAQKCMWIKRAANLDELWKIELFVKSPNNIFRIHSGLFNNMDESFYFDLGKCNERLMELHTCNNKNYLSGYIFNNNAFTLGLRSRVALSQLTNNYNLSEESKTNLFRIRYCNVVRDDEPLDAGTLSVVFGFRLLGEDLRNLIKLISTAKTKYSNQVGLSKSYEDFWGSFKKGSKTIRKILTKNKKIEISHNIVKFSSNTETVIGIEMAAKINSFWNSHFLSSNLSTFYFKLINNVLGLNYILCHFLPNIDRNCTFCNLAANPDEEDESPLHFFFSCSISERIINDFF